MYVGSARYHMLRYTPLRYQSESTPCDVGDSHQSPLQPAMAGANCTETHSIPYSIAPLPSAAISEEAARREGERSQVVFQVLILEAEVRLAPVHPVHTILSAKHIPCTHVRRKGRNSPRALIIKEPIRPLLVLLRHILRLLVPLEPRLVLLVEAPALALQRFGRKELLVGALAVVEAVEERVRVDAAVEAWIVEDAEGFLRVVGGGLRVREERAGVKGTLGVVGCWTCGAGGGEEGGVEWVCCRGLAAGLRLFEGVEEVGEGGRKVVDGLLFFLFLLRRRAL